MKFKSLIKRLNQESATYGPRAGDGILSGPRLHSGIDLYSLRHQFPSFWMSGFETFNPWEGNTPPTPTPIRAVLVETLHF
jgi:hypothetical protein